MHVQTNLVEKMLLEVRVAVVLVHDVHGRTSLVPNHAAL